jgi:precorrin-6B methylase 2
MSPMIKERMNTLFYFLLNEIFDKFDAIALKKLVDNLFTFSEKIIIHYPRLLPFYIDYYDDIIDNEIQIAQITSETKLLHIGCGSIPASIILLARKTGAIVQGIDKDKQAIENARICIQNLGISQSIDIRQGDALQMNILAYDVILISQGIVPKKHFLITLSKKLTKDHLIILRSFSTDHTLDAHDQFLMNHYAIQQIFSHNIHGSTVSIFLKKKLPVS